MDFTQRAVEDHTATDCQLTLPVERPYNAPMSRCRTCKQLIPTKRQIELRRARQLRYLERKKAAK